MSAYFFIIDKLIIDKLRRKRYNIIIKEIGGNEVSKYSGKCDFYDTIEIYGEDWIFNKFKFYIRTNKGNKEIHFNKKLDMMPFYANIISAMASNKETGGTIWFAQYPFPYEEDMDYWQIMTRRFKDRMKYASSQARKTGERLDINTVIDKFIHKYTLWRDDDPNLRAVCEQIAAKTKPIKYPLRNGAKWFMTELCKDMAIAGINPTEWGYIIENGKVIDFNEEEYTSKLMQEVENGSGSSVS